MDNTRRVVFLCEDSIEGVFTAVYDGYAKKIQEHLSHEQIGIQTGELKEPKLFEEYIEIIPDMEKVRKVTNTILQSFGQDTYLYFCEALATENPEKADAVYHAVATGLMEKNNKRRRAVMENLANPWMNKVFRMSLYAGNEIMHLKEFIRFQELENGVLFSEIGPKNNVITFLTPHFVDRFPNENFIIYDSVRDIVVLHAAFQNFIVTSGKDLNKEMIRNFSEKEREYRKLFTFFHNTIAIKERENRNLQRNMLPLRFREYMVEFTDKI